MKTIIIAILTLTTTIINAQNSVNWVGGTPGKETAWNEPKNWSNQRVPDEFSNVYINNVSSTTLAYPTIENGKVELNALFVAPNAELTINKDVQLVIYDYAEGIFSDNLKMNGSLFLADELETKSNKATVQQ